MNPTQPDVDSRVAVFVYCDNVSPDILEHALRVAAQFGRVVIRRGYGNHTTREFFRKRWGRQRRSALGCR